jgi:hypothetical protein
VTELQQQLQAALAFDEKGYVSETERRTRNSIPDAETLPSRSVGYSWGVRDENTRLAPLHALMIEAVGALDVLISKMDETDRVSTNMQWIAKITLEKEKQRLVLKKLREQTKGGT